MVNGADDAGAQYVETRLLDQSRWFERRAAQSKRAHEWLSIAALAAAAAVPLTVALGWPGWVAAAFGALGTVTIGLQGLFKHQENWLRYRTAAEGLRREHVLWEARVGPYAGKRPVGVKRTLVERTEALIAGEHDTWLRDQAAARDSGADGDEAGPEDGLTR